MDFTKFLKGDLEVYTKQDLIDLVVNEALCEKSISGFWDTNK